MPKPRHKRRHQQTPMREGLAPTAEWAGRYEQDHIIAPRIDGHDYGNATTVRRVSRAIAWCRWGWITGEQAKALVTLESMAAACYYGHCRSSLDTSPKGQGGDTPARVAMARKRFDELSKALTAWDHSASWTVLEWLEADRHPNFAEDYGTSRSDGRHRAQSLIRRVADRLCELLG